MNVEPYPGDVAMSGPDAPKCEQVEDLIRLLVTIHHRWGNTAVQYRVTWGGSALWAADELQKRIERLEAALRPFVEAPWEYDDIRPEDWMRGWALVEDIRKAREALGG
jgi:hypothetical protein